MLPQEKARFAVVANKAMNAALDNRKFIIGGENAIGANRDKLARARVMQKQGKDEGEIWDKTGWYLDKDGKWKFEINAAGGALKVDSARDFSGKLNDFLADDELFKAYPMLKDFSVEVTEFNEYATKGFYDGKTTIYLQKADELVAKPTLYHEIQHAVQDFENFARGGTEKSALKALKRTENQHLANNVKDMAQKSNTTRGDIAYRNLHGEVEARNVEQRMQNIDELEMGWHEGDELAEQELMDLINSHPHKTMDRKLDDTIIAQDKRRLRGRNAAAYSVGDGKEFSADEVAKNLPKNLSKAEKRRLELFGNFVNKSIKDTNLNKSFNFGTISKANAERLRTIKDYRGVEKHFNLDGYTLKINADIIRHIQNRHPDDFNLLYNLYDIYHNFDKAQWNLTRNKKTGKPEFSISFFKTYKDGEVKAVEIDMINEKELSLKTLFRP